MAKKKSLRTLSREQCSQEELNEVFAELSASSDRGAAILICVHLQDSLSDLIFLNMREQGKPIRDAMFGRDGPLYTFSSVIHLAFAMGIIKEDMWKQLDSIRQVRNVFAHALKPITFKTAEIATICGKLKASRSMRAIRQDFVPPAQNNPNRDIFISTCTGLSYYFLKRSTKTLKRKTTRLQRQFDRFRRKNQALLAGLLHSDMSQ